MTLIGAAMAFAALSWIVTAAAVILRGVSDAIGWCRRALRR